MGSNPKYIKSPGDYNKYTDYTFPDFWKDNKKKYKGKITAPQSKDILKRFALGVHEEILNNPDGFKLPSNIGSLIIAGTKSFPVFKGKSTKEKRVEHRNAKTNQVVYWVQYFFGKGRGKCHGSLFWRFRTTVPLRKKMKAKIDNNEFDHWYIVNKNQDIFRLGISPEIPRTHH